MVSLKIHHIGYLVKKMEKAKEQFVKLGFTPIGETAYDEIRKIDICFLEKDGYTVELVSPKSDDSVVANLMKRYKNAPYHICYESFNLEKDLEDLSSSGYVCIDTPTRAPALDDKNVVFLMHPNLGMIELLDAK